MEIKQVGIERNIQIAELKGLCMHDWKAEDDYFPNGVRSSFHWECIKCNKTDYSRARPHTGIKHWSTNRNDAWELWDELPNEYLQYTEDNGKYSISFYWKGNNRIVGKDFADCVSSAWITWKGNNDR